MRGRRRRSRVAAQDRPVPGTRERLPVLARRCHAVADAALVVGGPARSRLAQPRLRRHHPFGVDRAGAPDLVLGRRARQPDSRGEPGRRDGLDDIVSGACLEGVRDELVAAVARDEDDRQVVEFRDFGHQLDAASPGQCDVEQENERLFLGTDEVRELARLGSDLHGGARLRNRLADGAQRSC